ncbi:hypothetical protein Smp_188720, partial [Schistosoma mansoni]|uniref:hypothetical protein n=1 Tax=Schistosoma mansoni TaxID=6183 RepID=UPI00022C8663
VCFILRIHSVSSDCIWYGICDSSDPAHQKYCSYNGTAKALSNDGFKILSSLCPNYAVGNAKVCCDEDQLNYFSKSASLASMLLKRYTCACFLPNYLNSITLIYCFHLNHVINAMLVKITTTKLAFVGYHFY